MGLSLQIHIDLFGIIGVFLKMWFNYRLINIYATCENEKCEVSFLRLSKPIRSVVFIFHFVVTYHHVP